MLAASRVDRPGRLGRFERRIHVQMVRAGDSLWAIARRHGINVNTLASMNGMHPGDPLRAGQKIKLSTSQGRSSGGSNVLRLVVYTVRTGDTLRQIAKLFQVKVSQILTWNGMSSGTQLLKGQKLTIRVASRGG
jgi:membrane-bound lytic murein transglycosylase D